MLGLVASSTTNSLVDFFNRLTFYWLWQIGLPTVGSSLLAIFCRVVLYFGGDLSFSHAAGQKILTFSLIFLGNWQLVDVIYLKTVPWSSPLAGPVNANLIATLLQQHAVALRRYAAQWTICPDDCVQDAFVKLAGQTELPDSLAAWLYRVVKNGAINRAKSEQRREKHERLAAKQLAVEKMAADQKLGGSRHTDEQIELETALAKLNPTDRELIVLRIWSQLTWEEIANLTDQSSSGAQRHYVAALKTLKHLLEQPCSTNSTNPKNLNTTQIDCRPT